MTGWSITWGPHTWTDEDVTAGDAVDISVLCGDGWRSLDPTVSPVHLMTIVAQLASRDTGRTRDDIVEELRDLKAVDLAGMLQAREG